jgi:geranylgeranyl diphosphate synthase type II
VAPMQIACIAADAVADVRAQLEVFGRHVGIAFQIADDLLNLRDDTPSYGKETLGDLWEGKRTLMLLHALHAERDPGGAIAILAARRPPEQRTELEEIAAAVDDLHARGHIDTIGRTAVLAALRKASRGPERGVKTEANVRALYDLVLRNGGIGYAYGVALEHVRTAERALERCRSALAPGEARDFLFALPTYVVNRLR